MAASTSSMKLGSQTNANKQQNLQCCKRLKVPEPESKKICTKDVGGVSIVEQ
ncbi:hypothetical protein TIFTF001_014017 [Ficus carica]|uniref:Uncharacterized protein n=1 Tax=Ficus carica TaxID=3494 RepID=A0AA88A203_FICCA|nr:hypothetical protein TIFTF001_014017 [Ficus carica]